MDVLLPFFAHLNSTVILTKLMVLKLEAGSTTLEKKLFRLREGQLGWSSIQDLDGTWQDNYDGDEKMSWVGGPLLVQQRRDSPSQRVELTPVVRISALAKSWSWPGAAFNPSSESRTVQQSTAKSLVEPGYPLKSCLDSNHHQHHNHCQSISSHYHHKCKHPSLVRLASKSLELSSAPKA